MLELIIDSPTLFTAFAYYVIGGILIATASFVWTTNPVNRVFLFGEYLTPEGSRVVMKSWPLVSLFGLFIFSCAAEHHLHWLTDDGNPQYAQLLLFMGWVEAAISLIAAAIVLYMAARGCWRRSKRATRS